LKKIAVVVSRTSGGVSTIYSNLLRGFTKDKIHVKVLRLYEKMPLSILHDIVNTRYLRSFDSVIYIGGITWPSINFLPANVKKILFVHGFIYHESLSAIKKMSWKNLIGAPIKLLLYDMARFLDSIDYYICHSDTTCNMMRVPSEKKILLPQFFLENDLDFYRSLYYMYKDLKRQDNIVRIITYGSHVGSPRLLKIKHMVVLAKILKDATKKKIEFIIIDPSSEPYQDEIVEVIKPLPKERYLQLVASSNIYVERCIDEELGYGALEAMAMGTPVAKVTHPLYRSNIDYENALINAQSINELARVISQAIEQNDLERYSEAGMRYVKEKRTWNSVKSKLYEAVFYR